ncbi:MULTISPECIES: hypothetical protein [unclassified Streptomyces]|uniref:hypothetical protein n=1 Tax=unclassified Streptomyces TaxID=2593676 RepID=UPI000A89170D|nr:MULTISPECIES: hypothetical protein [unclassified Streptomyces]MYT79610.1 hypothetical protein [Streptomyces sp. SID8364]
MGVDTDDTFCATPGPVAPAPPGGSADGPPYAACVLCREPTEYPESTRGATLCPVCAWQEAARTACSG